MHGSNRSRARLLTAAAVVLAALWCGRLRAAAEPAAAAGATNDAAFYFVQITDTHLSGIGYTQRLQRVIESVNALPMPIECAVLTGDVTSETMDDGVTPAVATGLLARLNVPLYCLPGNHDILPQRLPQTLAAYTNAFGGLCRRAEHRGVVFLMLYTEPLRGPVRIEGYDPLAWLATELRNAGNKPVLVFHHTPSVEDFYRNRLHPGWPAAARRKWTELLNGANVKAVVAGHFHRDELHWVGNVPLYVCAPVANYWGRQTSYRIYEYRAGRLSYRTVYIE